MRFADKKYKGHSLALLFISFFSGFTVFNYQLAWCRWLDLKLGLHFVNIPLGALLFVIGLAAGYSIAESLLTNLGKNLLILAFVLVELCFVCFALTGKILFFDHFMKEHFLAGNRLLQTLLIIGFLQILPGLGMGASILMLSKAFGVKKNGLSNPLHISFVSGVVVSLLILRVIPFSVVDVENTIYLSAFLNFWCVPIALIHHSFTKDTIDIEGLYKNKPINF